MDIPKEFFTLQSMLTLSGATGVTYLICNGLQRAFNFKPAWLGLVVAVTISLFGVSQTSANKPVDYFVGIINGFLIYCAAAGGTELTVNRGDNSQPVSHDNQTGSSTGTMGGSRQAASQKRKFNSSWFR